MSSPFWVKRFFTIVIQVFILLTAINAFCKDSPEDASPISFTDDRLAGIVLSSSVVSYSKAGAVPTQALEKIRIPVQNSSW